MAGLTVSPGVLASIGGEAAAPSAPTLIDAVSNRDVPSWGEINTEPKTFSTTGLSWSAGQIVISFFGMPGSITLSAITGATNDGPGSLLADITVTGANFYIHSIPIVSPLDASFSYDQSGTARAVGGLLTLSADTGSLTTPVEANGNASSSLPSSGAITLPAAENVLLIAAALVRGAHRTNPIVAPSGYTMVTNFPVYSDDANAVASTLANTMAIATRTWAGSGGVSVPAAAWTGLADAVTNSQPWSTFHVAARPA